MKNDSFSPKIEFETDTITTLATTVNNELPVKIMVGEYQPEIKAQIITLPNNKPYKITITPLDD